MTGATNPIHRIQSRHVAGANNTDSPVMIQAAAIRRRPRAQHRVTIAPSNEMVHHCLFEARRAAESEATADHALHHDPGLGPHVGRNGRYVPLQAEQMLEPRDHLVHLDRDLQVVQTGSNDFKVHRAPCL